MPTTRRRAELAALLAGALALSPAAAQELPLPRGSDATFRDVKDPGVYALPVGPWSRDGLPVQRVEGRISVEAWQVPGAGLTPFQLLLPLREALVAAGYRIELDCATRACGGFDFRFATLVLPAPEMFVDLTEYHFISALSDEHGAVSLLASRDDAKSYVQIIRAGRGARADVTPDAPALAPARPVTPGDIAGQLESAGFVILEDLVFGTGSVELGGGDVASLDAIAAYLQANPGRRVLFVGHTDATGSLAANRKVSLRRAEAATAYLRNRHDTPAARIAAEGAGYLSPVASNLTPEGREANRRVEAVLIPTE